MITSTVLRGITALTLALFTGSAAADSFTSSASSAGSASSGSVSDSLSASSDSSSSGDKDRVASGDYRIIDIAEVNGRAEVRRLTLQAENTTGRFQLDLPAPILTEERLQRGDRVHVQPRVYGLEFAHSDNRQAFYLVLHDDWHNELAARPLLSQR